MLSQQNTQKIRDIQKENEVKIKQNSVQMAEERGSPGTLLRKNKEEGKVSEKRAPSNFDAFQEFLYFVPQFAYEQLRSKVHQISNSPKKHSKTVYHQVANPQIQFNQNDSIISQGEMEKPLWVVSTKPIPNSQVINYKTEDGQQLLKLSAGQEFHMESSF